MNKVWMLALCLISWEVSAVEFKYFKPSPELEQYINNPKIKRPAMLQAKSLSASPAEPSALDSMQVRLLDAATATNSGIDYPVPTDGEESPLYARINQYLQNAHKEIGTQQVSALDALNAQFNLGVQNFSGFSWHKPFGTVNIYVDRQVVPPSVVTQWLVQDTFTLAIEATTFLETLKDAGLNQMSSTEIGAFAGVTFTRTYTYYHYANSFAEGIRSDYSKLFMSFMMFNVKGIQGMGKDEFIKREDYWTASAGGVITTPPLYNISFSGGVLAEYAYKQSATVQRNYPDDASGQVVGMNVINQEGRTVGATLDLQLDFFNILQFSLLHADISYEHTTKNEYNLAFNAANWQHVQDDGDQSSELKSILRGAGSVKVLEPYVVRLDETDSTSIDSRGSVLIWGKLQKTKTETVRIIKDQNVKTFYKNYAQSVKVVQNLLSRLFSAVFYKIFKLPVGTKNVAIYSKQLTMEYEATHPQASDMKIMRIDSDEQFSFVLNQSYEAARTDRWLDKQYKNDSVWFLDQFTTLDKTLLANIKNDTLKGPLLIESFLRVEKAGFRYVMASSDDSLYSTYADICQSSKKADWSKEASRTKLLKTKLSGNESCVKSLGDLLIDFKKDYVANTSKPSLAKFKTFLAKVLKVSESISNMISLFGPENTFLSGKIQATTPVGVTFLQSFSNGQFRGLGVIDNYKRENGTRTPASVNE
jgi:hypothetical protein